MRATNLFRISRPTIERASGASSECNVCILRLEFSRCDARCTRERRAELIRRDRADRDECWLTAGARPSPRLIVTDRGANTSIEMLLRHIMYHGHGGIKCHVFLVFYIASGSMLAGQIASKNDSRLGNNAGRSRDEPGH